MKILVLGDVFGVAGRQAVIEKLPLLKVKYGVDFTIVNVENATHGRLASAVHCKEIFKAGADVLTLGDKVFDYQADINYFKTAKKVVRPLNIENQKIVGEPGIFSVKGKKVAVLSFLGKVFMETERRQMLSPYKIMDKVLMDLKLKENVDVIITDFHAEATSEKLCFAFKYGDKISAVFGTHTHIPTADKRILPSGCGYISDIGMCGVQNSAIGMVIDSGIEFMQKTYGDIDKRVFAHPEKSESGDLCGAIFDIDDSTGKTVGITQILPGIFE